MIRRMKSGEYRLYSRKRNPQTGKRLTARMKETRKTEDGGETANRRVFFDFTFSPPKSVSVAALVGDDPRIVAAHREAVKAAVHELRARFTEMKYV